MKLGRLVEHDPRSLQHAFEGALPIRRVMWRTYGAVLDQGNLGSCTGNAITGALNTVPLHKTGEKTFKEDTAVSIYSEATVIDGFPGQYPPDDTGSSGLAVCRVAKSRGLISAYQHAFTIEQALQALMVGPVITGVDWYEGFDTPDSQGRVQIAGQIRGGHEFKIVGYNPVNDLVTAVNSWGPGWGLNGRFLFKAHTTWAQLLSQQGDVTVPLR